MSDATSASADPFVTAGEYVLGVLSHEERRAVEARAEVDMGLARQIDYWSARFAPLGAQIEPVAPPSYLKADILRALFGEPKAPRRARAAAFWRFAASTLALIAVIAVSASVWYATQPAPDAPRPDFQALLKSSDAPALVAQIDLARGRLDILEASVDTGDRVAQLWLIPEGDTPKSLGLINASGATSVEIPEELRARIADTAILAVSLEPEGGSPTGQPTGPVVATGAIRVL